MSNQPAGPGLTIDAYDALSNDLDQLITLLDVALQLNGERYGSGNDALAKQTSVVLDNARQKGLNAMQMLSAMDSRRSLAVVSSEGGADNVVTTIKLAAASDLAGSSAD